MYVRVLRDSGGSIGSSIIIAAAEELVTAHDRTLLVQCAGHIKLTHDVSLSLPSRMGFVKRKATTKAKAKITQEHFRQMKPTYLQQVVSMVNCHKISAKLFINLDQTRLNIAPTSTLLAWEIPIR